MTQQDKIDRLVSGLMIDTADLVALAKTDTAAIAREYDHLRDTHQQLGRLLSHIAPELKKVA